MRIRMVCHSHWIVPFLTLALFASHASALGCIVCTEHSLDDYGECRTQHRFSCDQYARSLAPSERVFCRTTRKREQNETFTISKECISERDHYKLFPTKGYPLEEECDLIETHGAEVAYCLCRSENCNSKTILEQFMAFEEKHPELFGDISGDDDSVVNSDEDDEDFRKQEPRSKTSLPLSKASVVKGNNVAFGTPQLTPIMPINDPRSGLIENTPRRSQPSFEKSIDEEKRTVLPSRGLDSPLSIRKLQKTEQSPELLPEKPIDTMAPWSSARSLAEEPAPTEIVPSLLRCMQCGEGGLPDTASDCLLQVSVQCKNENSVCVSRHMLIGNGQNAVEKLCSSREAVNREYGLDGSTPTTQCVTTGAGRQRVCICSDKHNCNQNNVDKQMEYSLYGHNGAKANAAAPLPQPVVPIDLSSSSLASASAVAVPPLSTSHRVDASSSNNAAPQPIVPVVNGPPTARKSGMVFSGLRCAECKASELADPTADCSSSRQMDCMAKEGERVYCLTRQTQLSNGMFSVDKTCMTGLEFSDDFPQEAPAPGCGTAFGGLVNYCLCRGEMCNNDSLLTQAQNSVAAPVPPRLIVAATTTTTTSRPILPQQSVIPETDLATEEREHSVRRPDVETPKEISDINTNMIQPVEDETSDKEAAAAAEKAQREEKWKEENERILQEVAAATASSSLYSKIGTVATLAALFLR